MRIKKGFVLRKVCGEDVIVGEGQSQRIAIARGLLHPGDILLLDEISSSLDEPTERELYRRLFATYPAKTMLFITHRPIVTTQCDEVIKFDLMYDFKDK